MNSWFYFATHQMKLNEMFIQRHSMRFLLLTIAPFYFILAWLEKGKMPVIKLYISLLSSSLTSLSSPSHSLADDWSGKIKFKRNEGVRPVALFIYFHWKWIKKNMKMLYRISKWINSTNVMLQPTIVRMHDLWIYNNAREREGEREGPSSCG